MAWEVAGSWEAWEDSLGYDVWLGSIDDSWCCLVFSSGKLTALGLDLVLKFAANLQGI